MAKSKISKQDAAAAIREVEALKLRAQRLSYEQIGAKLRITRQAAHLIVTRALARNREECKAAVDDLRDIELAKLDELEATLLKQFHDGKNKDWDQKLKLADRIVKITEQRAKLEGTLAPSRTENKTEVSGKLPTREELHDVLRSRGVEIEAE